MVETLYKLNESQIKEVKDLMKAYSKKLDKLENREALKIKKDTIQNLQIFLKNEGLYNKRIDKKVGDGTKNGIEEFLKKDADQAQTKSRDFDEQYNQFKERFKKEELASKKEEFYKKYNSILLNQIKADFTLKDLGIGMSVARDTASGMKFLQFTYKGQKLNAQQSAKLGTYLRPLKEMFIGTVGKGKLFEVYEKKFDKNNSVVLGLGNSYDGASGRTMIMKSDTFKNLLVRGDLPIGNTPIQNTDENPSFTIDSKQMKNQIVYGMQASIDKAINSDTIKSQDYIDWMTSRIADKNEGTLLA